MGDVELPSFVGLGGLEAQVAALRSLMRLWRDEAASRQDPPDGAHRGAGPVRPFEVDRDRGRTGLVAITVELFADLDDLVLDGGHGAQGAGQRPP